MHKKHIVALVTLACLTASSAALAAAPDANVPNPVKGDSGIQMNRMRTYLERERVKR